MIELTILFIVNVFDAFRDGQSTRKQGVGWWQWHIPKWICFFAAQGYVSYRFLDRYQFTTEILLFFSLVVISFWIVWKYVYQKVRTYWNCKYFDLN